MEYIAVNGCELALDHGSGSISISSTPSTKVKAGGKGCYKGKISFSVSGFSGTKITNSNGSGSGNISGSAEHVLIEGDSAVLANDEVTVTLKGTAGTGQSEHQESEDVTVKVKKAGQDKVIGA